MFLRTREPFWGIFGFILVIFSSVFETYSILFYYILCRCFLYYPDSRHTKKNYTAYIPLLRSLCSIFILILCILLNVLRNIKENLDISHECLVVTKLTNALFLPFPCVVWVVLVYFVVCSLNRRELPNILIWIFVFSLFGNIKQ